MQGETDFFLRNMKGKTIFFTEDTVVQHMFSLITLFLPFLDLDNSSETGSKGWNIFLASVSQHDPNSNANNVFLMVICNFIL